MKKVIVLVLLEVLQLSTIFCQYSINISTIEVQLEKMTATLINEELKVAQSLSLCNAYVNVSSSNLKASNIVKNLTNTLDNTTSLLLNLKTIKNYPKFESLVNYSTCDYVISRLSTSEYDSRNFDKISFDVMSNLSQILEKRNEIASNYAANYKILYNFWSKQKTVVNAIRQMGITVNGFINYLRVLDMSKKNLVKTKSYLNSSLTSLRCPILNNSFQTRGENIEAKLLICEDELQALEVIAMNKIESALKTVTSTKVSASFNKSSLQSLDKGLEECNTVSNFPSLKWPQLPDVPRSGMTIKLRSTQEKKKEFRSFQEECFENKSRIAGDRKALDDAGGNVSAVKKVKAEASVMSEIVKATIDVENKFDEYSQLLNVAIDEIEKVEDEVQGITPTIKVTSTTTSSPVTTSEVPSPITSTSTSAVLSSTTTSTMTSTIPVTSTTSTLTSTVPSTTSTSTTTSTIPLTTTTSTSTSTVPTTTTTSTTTSTVPSTTTTSTSTSTSTTTTTTTPTTTSTTTTPTTTTTTPTTTTSTTVPATTITTLTTTTNAPRMCPTPYNDTAEPIYYPTGAYKKSICEIKIALSLGNATSECTKHGMAIFAIVTKEDFDTLKAYITRVHGVGTDVSFMVSGWISGTDWFVAYQGVKPLYPGAVPTDPTLRNCLKIGGDGSQLVMYRTPCGAVDKCICEWI